MSENEGDKRQDHYYGARRLEGKSFFLVDSATARGDEDRSKVGWVGRGSSIEERGTH